MLWQVRCVLDVHRPLGLVISFFVSSVEVGICPVCILGSVCIMSMPYCYWRSPWILALQSAALRAYDYTSTQNAVWHGIWLWSSLWCLTCLLCLFMNVLFSSHHTVNGLERRESGVEFQSCLKLNNPSVYILSARVWFWAFTLVFECGCVILKWEGGLKCAGRN